VNLAEIVEQSGLDVICAGHFIIAKRIEGPFGLGELCSISNSRKDLLSDWANDGGSAILNSFN